MVGIRSRVAVPITTVEGKARLFSDFVFETKSVAQSLHDPCDVGGNCSRIGHERLKRSRSCGTSTH
jgi:hypothetical protein